MNNHNNTETTTTTTTTTTTATNEGREKPNDEDLDVLELLPDDLLVTAYEYINGVGGARVAFVLCRLINVSLLHKALTVCGQNGI